MKLLIVTYLINNNIITGKIFSQKANVKIKFYKVFIRLSKKIRDN